MGNDDNSPTNKVTGGSLPAQVWHDVMEPAHAGFAPAALPGYIAPDAQSPADQVAEVEPQAQQEDQNYNPRPRRRNFFEQLFGIGDGPIRVKKPHWQQTSDDNGLY